MIKKIMAVIAAAICAGVIVTLEPGLAPEITARASPIADQDGSPIARVNIKPVRVAAPSTAYIHEAAEQNIQSDSRNGTSSREQSWPYYGQACLRDGNQTAGNVRIVRVIDMDRSAASSTRDTGRKSQTRTW
jgi:hypothetical protein